MTQSLEGMSLVKAMYPAEVAQEQAKLARLEAQHPEMAYAAVRRVNLAMALTSRLSWYSYELKPQPTNAVKEALKRELEDAMEELRLWHLKSFSIAAHAHANLSQAIREGRLKG